MENAGNPTQRAADLGRNFLSVIKDAASSAKREGLAGLFGLLAFFSGLAVLIIRGCMGYGRPFPEWGIDFYKIHRAGEYWLIGRDPYIDPAICHAYPPQSSLVTSLLGLMSFDHARWVNLGVSIAALFGIFALYIKWFRNTADPGREAPWWPALVGFGYVMASNFTTSSLFFGGIQFPVYLAAAIAWYLLYEKNRPYLAGVFLALGTLKPQFGLFLLLFLLLDGRWRTLLVAGVVDLVMSIPAMIQLGPIGSIEGWRHAIVAYRTSSENVLGGGGVLTFDSVLTAFKVSGISVIFVAVLCFLAVFMVRRRIERKHLLIILPFLSLAFVYSHDGDYVAMSLMWLCLFEAAARAPARFAALSLFALLLFIPTAAMESTGSAFLLHWRIFVVTGIFAAYMLSGGPYFRNRSLTEPAIP